MAESVHFVTGALKLTVCEAKGIKNKGGLLGKMDPYCVIKAWGEKHKTKVHKNGGASPKWDQAFLINCKDTPSKETIEFTVWDSDIGMDDKSSQTEIKLHDLLTKIGASDPVWFQMMHPKKKSQDAGYLRVEVSFDGTLPDVYTADETKAAAAPVAAAVAAAVTAAAPVAAAAAYVAPAAAAPASPWTNGRTFFAKGCSGKNLRIMPTNEVNSTGGGGALAKFTVSAVDGKRIQFKNAQGKTMRVFNGLPDGGGGGGSLCWFTPVHKSGNEWCFGTHQGGFLGTKPDGSAKPHAQTGQGPHGTYTIVWA